jgi:hypothetical protein
MLQLDHQQLPVEVIDESATGFGVCALGQVDCQIGGMYLLRIAKDWYEVQVVGQRVDEQAVAPTIDTAQCDTAQLDGTSTNAATTNAGLANTQLAEVEGMQGAATEVAPVVETPAGPVVVTRIGLLRLRDVDPSEFAENKPRLISWENLRSMRRSLTPVKKPMVGMMLVLGIVVLGGVLIFALEGSKPVERALAESDPLSLPEGKMIIHKTVKVKGPPAKPLQQTAKRVPAPKPIVKKKDLAKAAQTLQDFLPHAVIRQARPHHLLKPQVKQLLSLSEQQLASLERLVDEYQTRASDSRAGDLDEFHLNFGRRVLSVLDAKQRKAWRQLAESPELLERMLAGESEAKPERGVLTSDGTPTEAAPAAQPDAAQPAVPEAN